jgi:hypothetical protein
VNKHAHETDAIICVRFGMCIGIGIGIGIGNSRMSIEA